MAESDKPALGTRPAHLIMRLARLFTRVSDARLRGHGISSAAFPVFGALWDGTPRTQKVLAEAARIEQPSMAQMLAKLEKNGLIARSPDPEDGRSSLIVVTEAGRALYPVIADLQDDGQRWALDGFSKVEAATLVDLLTRMIRNIEAVERRD